MINQPKEPLPLTPQPLREAIINILEPNHVQPMKESKASTNQGSICDIDSSIRELELLQIVNKHQSYLEPGYLTYQNWLLLNRQLWGPAVLPNAQQLWKILRIINYGQILVPTGLTFDIAKVLTQKKPAQELRKVLETFLRTNKVKQGLRFFRELSNYSSLEEIVQRYCGRKEKKKKKVQQSENCQVFERLSCENRKKEKQVRNMTRELVQEIDKCPFKPQISNYKPLRQKIMNKRPCQHPPEPQTLPEEPFLLKPLELDSNIFKGSIQDIPGANAHVQRLYYVQFERLRRQRFIERGMGTFK